MTTTIVERVDMTQKAKTPPLWSCKHRLNISVFCCRGGRQAGRGSHTVTNHWKARAQKRNESNALTRVGHVHVLTGSYRDCSTGGKKQTHAVTVSTLHKFVSFFNLATIRLRFQGMRYSLFSRATRTYERPTYIFKIVFFFCMCVTDRREAEGISNDVKVGFSF